MGTPIDRETGKPTLTPKERKFVTEYVRTGNGTQSALAAYDTESENAASVISAQNLGKLRIRTEVQRLMAENGLELNDVFRIHKRNMEQSDHLPTSQKAVSDAYNVLGMTTSDKPTTDVKVAFIIEAPKTD